MNYQRTFLHVCFGLFVSLTRRLLWKRACGPVNNVQSLAGFFKSLLQAVFILNRRLLRKLPQPGSFSPSAGTAHCGTAWNAIGAAVLAGWCSSKERGNQLADAENIPSDIATISPAFISSTSRNGNEHKTCRILRISLLKTSFYRTLSKNLHNSTEY